MSESNTTDKPMNELNQDEAEECSMTDESSAPRVQQYELPIMLVLLIGGLVLMYFGRATMFYYGSYLSAGLGGIIFGINGIPPSEATRFIRPEASFADQVTFWTGGAMIMLNTIVIRGGLFRGR